MIVKYFSFDDKTFLYLLFSEHLTLEFKPNTCVFFVESTLQLRPFQTSIRFDELWWTETNAYSSLSHCTLHADRVKHIHTRYSLILMWWYLCLPIFRLKTKTQAMKEKVYNHYKSWSEVYDYKSKTENDTKIVFSCSILLCFFYSGICVLFECI